MSIPNLLTALRFVAVPVFAWLYLAGHHGAALAVFIAAGVTDVLDGALARALKQFTRLGAIMDPVADKALALSALALLTWSALLPKWLLGLALFRDVCIFLAIALLGWTGRTFEMRPTRFGKYATFFLLATIVLALTQEAHRAGQVASPALQALVLVDALCLFASWAQYLAILIGLMRKPRAAPPGKLGVGFFASAIAGRREAAGRTAPRNGAQ